MYQFTLIEGGRDFSIPAKILKKESYIGISQLMIRILLFFSLHYKSRIFCRYHTHSLQLSNEREIAYTF
jgi:hypothetical protein